MGVQRVRMVVLKELNSLLLMMLGHCQGCNRQRRLSILIKDMAINRL